MLHSALIPFDIVKCIQQHLQELRQTFSNALSVIMICFARLYV